MNTPDLPADPAATLADLDNCRRAMVNLLRTEKPMGPTYHGASIVMAAIDAFGAVLTGAF